MAASVYSREEEILFPPLALSEKDVIFSPCTRGVPSTFTAGTRAAGPWQTAPTILLAAYMDSTNRTTAGVSKSHMVPWPRGKKKRKDMNVSE